MLDERQGGKLHDYTPYMAAILGHHLWPCMVDHHTDPVACTVWSGSTSGCGSYLLVGAAQCIAWWHSSATDKVELE